jgi:hypothetical protein
VWSVRVLDDLVQMGRSFGGWLCVRLAHVRDVYDFNASGSGVDSVLHKQQATRSLLGLRCCTLLEKCTETFLATLGSIRAHHQMSGCWCRLRVDDLLIRLGVGLGVGCVVDASGVLRVLHKQLATGGLLGLRCRTQLKRCAGTLLATLGSRSTRQMSGCCWLRVDDLGMGVGLGVECVVDASGVDSVLHIQQATGGLLGLRCRTRLEKCTETYLATLGSIRAHHRMSGCWCRLRVDDLLIRLGVGLGIGCVVDAGKCSVLHMQQATGGLLGLRCRT